LTARTTIRFAVVPLALAAVLALPTRSFAQSSSWATPSRARTAGSGEDRSDEQQADRPAARAQTATALSGRVRSIDPSGSTMTMEDGTNLRLPPAIQRLNEAALREGVTVEAAYDNQGGYNVVRDLRIIGR
jgi:Cu/Ag efflux protein CusF